MTMLGKLAVAILFGISCVSASGCLCRANNVSGQIGASGDKARGNPAYLVSTADNKPASVSGTVLLEDRATPLKDARITLRKKGREPVVSTTYTDLIGNFNLTGVTPRDTYIIEVDSSDYVGNKEIMVEPDSDNWHEIIVFKR